MVAFSVLKVVVVVVVFFPYKAAICDMRYAAVATARDDCYAYSLKTRSTKVWS